MKNLSIKTTELLCLTLYALGLSSCTTTHTVAPTELATELVLKSGTPIIVLEPLLTYESAGTEQKMDGQSYSASEVKDDLMRQGCAAFKNKGCQILDSQGFQPHLTNSAALARELSENASQFFRGMVPTNLLEKLRVLGGVMPEAPVLVHYCKVKVGPGGSWDPNTGAITSSMHASQFQVALFDSQTGRMIWKNQAFMRAIPTTKSKHYQKAIDLLYQNSTTNK